MMKVKKDRLSEAALQVQENKYLLDRVVCTHA